MKTKPPISDSHSAPPNTPNPVKPVAPKNRRGAPRKRDYLRERAALIPPRPNKIISPPPPVL